MVAAGDAGDGEIATDGVAVGDACGALCVSSTERVPKSGNDNVNASTKNDTAEMIVIFDNNVAVPRGPNAVLETELVNSAPASALPGCNKLEIIKTTHDSANNVYKR